MLCGVPVTCSISDSCDIVMQAFSRLTHSLARKASCLIASRMAMQSESVMAVGSTCMSNQRDEMQGR